MKKFFKSMLIGLMGLSLVACGGNGESNEEANDGDENTKVALMVESLGDLSFNDSAEEGVLRADEDLGIDATVIEYGEDIGKLEATLLDVADTGYDVIIGPSTLADYYGEHAEDYPDTQFVLFDATADYDLGDGLENVYSIVYSANEASFAAGYLAAKQSETGVIGFLGGEQDPAINDFLVGYIEGALQADPDIKVGHSFVGNWSDSAKGKELSLAMINQKADIIFGAAGGATMGIFEASAEKDTQAIGVDFDQALVFEENGNDEFAELTISSVMKNVGDSLYRALELYEDGTLKTGEAEVLGIKEDGVGIPENKYYEAAVSEEIREEVDEISEEIADGSINVESFYDIETTDFEDLKSSVEP